MDDQLEKMSDAIAAVLAQDEDSPETAGGILTGYVLVTEHYGTDGSTWCQMYSGTKHSARTMGLLRWADVRMQLGQADRG